MTNTTAPVTICLDCIAILLVILLDVKKRIRRDTTMGGRIFVGMTATVTAIAVFDLIAYAQYGHTSEWSRILAFFSRTVSIFAILCLVYEWYLYVDYQLFGSRDHIRRRYRFLFVPLLIHGICLVINPFTGIVFTINPDLSITPQVMYYVIQVTDYLYFLAAAVLIFYQVRHGEAKRFFHPEWLFITVIVGEILNFFLPYHITPLDLSAGLLFVCVSMSARWSYDDESSGFFNRSYVSDVLMRLKKGEKNWRSVMTFEAAGSGQPLIEILHEEMPKNGEMIRTGEKSFLLCMEQSDRLVLDLLKQNVEEAAEEYDIENPAQKIGLRISCHICNDREEMEKLLKGWT